MILHHDAYTHTFPLFSHKPPQQNAMCQIRPPIQNALFEYNFYKLRIVHKTLTCDIYWVSHVWIFYFTAITTFDTVANYQKKILFASGSNIVDIIANCKHSNPASLCHLRCFPPRRLEFHTGHTYHEGVVQGIWFATMMLLRATPKVALPKIMHPWRNFLSSQYIDKGTVRQKIFGSYTGATHPAKVHGWTVWTPLLGGIHGTSEAGQSQ